MTPKNLRSLIGTLSVLLFTVLYAAGCGGGTQGQTNQTQQQVISVSLSGPASLTVQAGTTTQITAVIANDPSNKGANWTVSCSAQPCGSVSPTSTVSGSPTTYTAPAAAPSSALTVMVTATSLADNSKSISVTITIPAAVAPALSVSVNPPTATVQPGKTAQFTATVTNDPANAGVTWTVYCSSAVPGAYGNLSCGNLSQSSTASGVSNTYTAPTFGDMTVSLTATSVTNGAVLAAAIVSVPGIAVVISPASVHLNPGATQQFSATVQNDPSNQGVTWSLVYLQNGGDVPCPSAAVCGTVSSTNTASGATTTYTAPTTPPAGNLEVTIVAVPVANPAFSSECCQGFIYIAGIAVSVAPGSANVEAGSTAQFSASVSGDPSNGGVTWSISCSAPPCGTVSPTSTASGAATTYSAPATAPASDLSVTLTAASVTNSAAAGNAQITVPAITVGITPPSALVPLGSALPFTASVSDDPQGKGASWALSQGGSPCSPACGSIAPTNTVSGSATVYTAPSSLPASTAVSVVASSASDSTKTAVSSVTLTKGSVQLVPYGLNLGSVLVHQTSSPQIVTLTNTGGSTLTISGISISGANSGDFAQTNTCNSAVAAGSSCAITVTFTPAATGTRNAEISVADSSIDSPQVVGLTGSGHTRGPKLVAAIRSSLAATKVAAVPPPTGAYFVGTQTIHVVDSTRQDPYLTQPANRELAVRLWYPAAIQSACNSAEYTTPSVWQYFAELAGVKPFHVITNSCANSPVVDGPHPVVVLEPGYTASFTDYTFLAEDLASRGYVVASVAHTYETTAVELANGSLAKSLMGSYLAETWRGDQASLTLALQVRVLDLQSAVNELSRLNSQTGSPFAGRLDMSKLGVAGHSFGGSSAFLAAKLDSRFKSVVMLDAPLPRALVATTKTPVFLLTAGREQWDESEHLLWNGLEGPRLAVNVLGSEHVAFSDYIWLAKDAVETGPMGSDKTMSVVRDYVASFLDANLRGEAPSLLLTAPSSDYPDAVVVPGDTLALPQQASTPCVTCRKERGRLTAKP